jgi:hypothetical protein
MEHQKGGEQAVTSDLYTPVSVEHMLEVVSRQRAEVLYYSLAGGFLYSWLLSPGKGMGEHTHTHTDMCEHVCIDTHAHAHTHT